MVENLSLELDRFSKIYKISERQRDVVECILSGDTESKTISRSLGISQNTVRIHLKNLNQKTKVNSKTAIVVKFINFCFEH